MADKAKDPGKKTETDPPAQRRLLRSSDDKVLAGVAGGLARYIGTDPTFVRLGFALAAFFGGFGIIAYLVMAVVVPEDDGSGRPLPNHPPPRWALVLLALAVLSFLPGPFIGWHHHWWLGFAGPFWFFLLLAGAIVIFYPAVTGRRLRLRRMLSGPRSSGKSSAEADTAETKTEEAGTEEIHTRSDTAPRVIRALAVIVLIGAALLGCAALAVGAAWLTATGNGSVVAGVVIALGVAIAATAFIADTRRWAAPLLVLALALGLPAGAVAAADINFDGGIGQRTYTPTVVADVPADGYQLGVGQLIVDLRSLPWKPGQAIPVSTDLGIGQMIVSVPSSVCVHAHATGKAGELLVRGDKSDGVDPEVSQGEPRSNAPRLDLNAKIQLGQMIVTDQPPGEIDSHGVDYDHNRLSKESQQQTCGL